MVLWQAFNTEADMGLLEVTVSHLNFSSHHRGNIHLADA